MDHVTTEEPAHKWMILSGFIEGASPAAAEAEFQSTIDWFITCGNHNPLSDLTQRPEIADSHKR